MTNKVKIYIAISVVIYIVIWLALMSFVGCATVPVKPQISPLEQELRQCRLQEAEARLKLQNEIDQLTQCQSGGELTKEQEQFDFK